MIQHKDECKTRAKVFEGGLEQCDTPGCPGNSDLVIGSLSDLQRKIARDKWRRVHEAEKKEIKAF